MTRRPLVAALLGGLLLLVLAPAAARAAIPGVNVAGAPTADRIDKALATGASRSASSPTGTTSSPTAPASWPARSTRSATRSRS